MRDIFKNLLLSWQGGSGGSAPLTPQQIYEAYVASVGWLTWLKYNETSGTTVVNYGSLGSASDGVWTAGVGAQGQTGLGNGGANEAYSYDGANSLVLIPAEATLNNLTTFTYGMLLNPASAGEGNQGYLFAQPDASLFRAMRINTVDYALRCFNSANVASANSVTNVNFLTTGVPAMVFATYDDAGDRLIHIYKATGSSVTEATYTTHTAASGTVVNGSGACGVGNRPAQANTLNAVVDEFYTKNTVVSTAVMQQMALLRGL